MAQLPAPQLLLVAVNDLPELQLSYVYSRIMQQPLLVRHASTSLVGRGCELLCCGVLWCAVLCSPSQAEVEEAARAANAHDFIMELPEGYNTVVTGNTLARGTLSRPDVCMCLVPEQVQ